jgi:hypothetical protein
MGHNSLAIQSQHPTLKKNSECRLQVPLTSNNFSIKRHLTTEGLLNSTVFCVVTPYSRERARHFGGIYCLELHYYLSTLKTETIGSSETSLQPTRP